MCSLNSAGWGGTYLPLTMLLSLRSLASAAGAIGSLSRLLCLNPAARPTEKKGKTS